MISELQLTIKHPNSKKKWMITINTKSQDSLIYNSIITMISRFLFLHKLIMNAMLMIMYTAMYVNMLM